MSNELTSHIWEQHLIHKCSETSHEIHEEIVGEFGQIIRLHPDIFSQVEKLLSMWRTISLFNAQSSINNKLLEKLEAAPDFQFTAKVFQIIDRDGGKPVLDWDNAILVKVPIMQNLHYDNISDQAVQMSIPGYEKNWVIGHAEMLEWILNSFYKNSLLRDELIKKWLFFRQITL